MKTKQQIEAEIKRLKQNYINATGFGKDGEFYLGKIEILCWVLGIEEPQGTDIWREYNEQQRAAG